MKHCLQGIQHMHQRHVCHADIKPCNLVVSMALPLTCCIVDFGTAWLDRDEMRPTFAEWSEGGRVHLGTLAFRSPECLLGWPFWGMSSDIWSLGWGESLAPCLGWDVVACLAESYCFSNSLDRPTAKIVGSRTDVCLLACLLVCLCVCLTVCLSVYLVTCRAVVCIVGCVIGCI